MTCVLERQATRKLCKPQATSMPGTAFENVTFLKSVITSYSIHYTKLYDDLKLRSLRDLIGNVNQEPILFNDTIRNNIAFGVENASEDEIKRAAKIANAHEFILATENGYDTKIGDRGDKLSGGQKQRLSIARAILLV